ncbi:hypothetical protein Y032_0544g3231 [Ancylostoma ceylanicum]|uniref:Cystinosin n=1 Tax=Ancylostoma ceylanicum TaxID=53326 RepID=A0A016WQL9_9BILA|nr:hypothetical protein Y032_0544g3231 [Ancylostoma ceylanicum]
MLVELSILFAACCSSVLGKEHNFTANPNDVVLEIDETTNITYHSKVPLVTNVQLYFNRSDYFDTPDSVELEQSTGEAVIQLTGRKPVSLVYLDIADCTTEDGSECQLDTESAYVRVSVIKSHLINLFTIIVGWMYFAAWSLSFYPQIYLNFKRKSVTGLNFDFLLLNLIGFSAYAIYNLLMYYDPVVQNEYETKHPRSPIPVLLNDVVFAVHAFAACVVTAAQCFLLERANQRVSVTCMILSALLILFAIGSGVATVLKFLTILQFVMCFSYIKMAVTLSKYFPQQFNMLRVAAQSAFYPTPSYSNCTLLIYDRHSKRAKTCFASNYVVEHASTWTLANAKD